MIFKISSPSLVLSADDLARICKLLKRSVKLNGGVGFNHSCNEYITLIESLVGDCDFYTV